MNKETKQNAKRIAAGVFALQMTLQGSFYTQAAELVDTPSAAADSVASAVARIAAESAETDAAEAADAEEVTEPAAEVTEADTEDVTEAEAAEPETFTVTEEKAASADALSISGAPTVPDTLKKGTACSIGGTVSSGSSKITALTAGVYDSNGKFVTGKTVNPGATSYNVHQLDNYVTFNTLPAGSYTYAVIASNASHSNYTLVNKHFTVTEGNAEDAMSISGGNAVPEKLSPHQAVSVTGTVTSASSNMTALTVGIYDSNGKFVTGKTVNPGAKSYDLKNLDRYVLFDSLPEGSYLFAVIASNARYNNFTLVSKKFTVGGGGSGVSAGSDKLSISGGTQVPDVLAPGKALTVKGTVTSESSKITALTVGVYDSAGKFVTGKTVAPNAKSYDIKKLDNYVEFNKLPAGTYSYCVIATNAKNSNTALVNKKFTVGDAASDKLTISGGTQVPDTLAVGKALTVTGTVTSATSNITALTVGVYDSAGNFVTGKTIAPNAKSYNLKNLDNYVEFNKLKAGSYRYCVIATNAAHKDSALVNKAFTVGSGGTTSSPGSATSDKLSLSGGTKVPANIAVGTSLRVTGTVTSASSNMTALTVGVYNISGQFVTGKTIAPKSKSYDLKNLDSYVEFNKLPAGRYVYAVIASNAANKNFALANQQFTVGGSQNSAKDALTISGGTNMPATIKKGTSVAVRGKVTSASSNMTMLAVGVYSTAGKFVTGRTVAPNAKSFDLSRLDKYVEFNKLPAGKYVYAVIASNASVSNYAIVGKVFTVQ